MSNSAVKRVSREQTSRKAADRAAVALTPSIIMSDPEVTVPLGTVGGGHSSSDPQREIAPAKNSARKRGASANSDLPSTRSVRSPLIAEPASIALTSSAGVPVQQPLSVVCQVSSAPHTNCADDAELIAGRAISSTTSMKSLPDRQPHPADGCPFGHDARSTVAPVSADLIDRLIEAQRKRRRLMKAQQRLVNQAQAICRAFTSEDDDEKAKKKAGALYASVVAGKCTDLAVICAVDAYILAQQPLIDARAATERDMVPMARALPVWPYVKDIKGVAELSLASIVGECGDLSNYATVSRVWKRMGLAVISGGRQRRVTGDAALEHGYDAQRRSVVWNIGECIIKAQWRSAKEDSPAHAIGPLGEYYGEEKAKQLAKELTPGHANNRAKRHMTKRFLRDLATAWWRSSGQVSE